MSPFIINFELLGGVRAIVTRFLVIHGGVDRAAALLSGFSAADRPENAGCGDGDNVRENIEGKKNHVIGAGSAESVLLPSLQGECFFRF